MKEQFVSEPIRPVPGTADAAAMAAGAPGLPRRFTWRETEYEVAEVLDQWRETRPCKHGSDEMYARKHWFRIRTTDGTEMTIYFERQPRSGHEVMKRWWLFARGQRSERRDSPHRTSPERA